MKPKTPIVDRFWSHVEKTDRCWLWSGNVNESGYGRISRGGRRSGTRTAHRLSWEIHFGSVPEGMSVLHRCDVRACVNPDHLFLGTQADNVADMYAKSRNRNIGPIGEQAPAAKLTIEQVRQILNMPSSVETARRFGISYRHLRQLKTGVRWAKALAWA